MINHDRSLDESTPLITGHIQVLVCIFNVQTIQIIVRESSRAGMPRLDGQAVGECGSRLEKLGVCFLTGAGDVEIVGDEVSQSCERLFVDSELEIDRLIGQLLLAWTEDGG